MTKLVLQIRFIIPSLELKKRSLKAAAKPATPAAPAAVVAAPGAKSDVRSPTSTSTSTKAKTTGNITVTGGAGAGATTEVHVHHHPSGDPSPEELSEIESGAMCPECGKPLKESGKLVKTQSRMMHKACAEK